MEKVLIKSLRVDTLIGVHSWEKKVRQQLLMDLELGFDNRKAASSDNLKYAVDYEAVSQHIVSFCKQHQFKLIESLAEHLANSIINTFKLPWLKLTVNKHGAIANADCVGVVIEKTSGSQD